MKKIILSFALLGMGFFANAQDDSSYKLKQNEVKLNLARTFFEQFAEFSYERMLAEDLGVGTNLGFSYAKKAERIFTFQMIPYVNWYFSGSSESTKQYASGFFIQANAAVSNQKTFVDETSNSTNFGLGAAFGWKYVSANNWTGSVYFGGGRNIYNSSEGFDVGYITYGLSIGKRF